MRAYPIPPPREKFPAIPDDLSPLTVPGSWWNLAHLKRFSFLLLSRDRVDIMYDSGTRLTRPD